MVARQLPNNSSLFINIGTTTEEIAKALCNHQRLKVITNNLHVASILSTNVNFEVIVAGGLVRHRDGGLIGEATVDFIDQNPPSALVEVLTKAEVNLFVADGTAVD